MYLYREIDDGCEKFVPAFANLFCVALLNEKEISNLINLSFLRKFNTIHYRCDSFMDWKSPGSSP